MELGLNGKVVVVTGGATGIGLETARAFLQEGCKVAICGRRMEKLQKAKKFLGSERVFVYQADMTDLEQVETFAAAVAKEYGSIDVWINNAGAMWIKPLMEMSSEEFRREIDLNLTTVFHGAKAAYPYMKAQGGGVILNASSFAALDPNAGRATYSAAKAAVKNLSASMAAEFAAANIRVLAYVPGMIATEIAAGTAACTPAPPPTWPVGSGSTRTGPGPNTLAPGLRCRWPTQRRLRTAPPPSAGRRLSKSCPGNGNWR